MWNCFKRLFPVKAKTILLETVLFHVTDDTLAADTEPFIQSSHFLDQSGDRS